MIYGLHLLWYSKDPAADRAFLRDVLGWASIEDADSEPGWLIFKTPPAELGVHPTDGDFVAEIYLMCEDVDATAAVLAERGVEVGAIADRGWGRVTTFKLPSGANVGLYQPTHPTALDLV
ncbi:MAG: extradiol dioxygenase [Hamadaea sp.]|nr:extradiol dioxygenase [Hamadaea sp.]